MPDIEKIKRFATMNDRTPPEVFVGRETELDFVSNVIQKAKQGEVLGNTVLFSGAPGAGKTSLLHQIQIETLGQRDGEIKVCSMPVGALMRQREFVIRLAMALGVPVEVFHETQSREIQGKVGTGGTGVQRARRVASSPPEPDFPWLEFMAKKTSMSPIMLLIDEIQNVEPEAPAAQDILGRLHEGKLGMPIVPVFAGLSNSPSVLDRAGFSRPSEEHEMTLGCLDSSEVEQYFTSMLKRAHVAFDSGTTSIAQAIARATDGWPQHVHTHVSAVFQALLRSDGQWRDINWTLVESEAQRRRLRGYARRCGEEVEQALLLLGEVLSSLPDRASRSLVLDTIERASEHHRLPKGMDASDFLLHLIRKGVFQHAPERGLECPIPSFRGYLIERSREESRGGD